jgi:uncharacterized protein with PQ loop repeat
MRCEGGRGDLCCWLWLSVLSNNINVASQLRSLGLISFHSIVIPLSNIIEAYGLGIIPT